MTRYAFRYAPTFAPAFPARGFRREVEKLFDEVLQSPAATGWQPLVDARESAAGLTFEFDLPGVPPESIEVDVLEGMLRVRGKREQTTVKEDERQILSERTSGSFERRFRLPKEADPESVSAQYALGMLTVTVAHRTPVQPRKVTIQVEKPATVNS